MITDDYLERLARRDPTSNGCGFTPGETAGLVHILPDIAGQLLAYRRAARSKSGEPNCMGLQARLFLARQIAASPERHTHQAFHAACKDIALLSGNALEVKFAKQALAEMQERAA